MPRRTALVVLLVLVTVVGTAWFVRGLSAERRDAEARWDLREPSAYSFSYFYCGGMCANCSVRVTVRDGAVTDALAEKPSCSDPEVGGVPTVEELFAIAKDHQPWPWSDRTSVSYDEVWGFPTRIRFTCAEGTTDCGGGWSASDFVDLS